MNIVASHSKPLTRMASYTSRLLPPYGDEFNQFNPVGGLEIARSARRWEDFKRKHPFDGNVHRTNPTAPGLGWLAKMDKGDFIGRQIAYGYQPKEDSTMGTKLEVEYFNRRFAAIVQPEPLYDPRMTRLK